MNEMNREMRRMSEREERLAKKADRNVGKYQSGEKVSRLKRVANYLGEVRTELKRVNWPTSSTLTSFTVVTIVTIAFFTIFIFGMDFSFKNTLINLLSFGG
ncbi:MAG: preprotein translocase subunit SecE [Candidatus Actinomarina sp.]